MSTVSPPVRAPLRAPFTVCLWLTDYCNLNCSYCYAKPFSGRRMDSGRVLTLVDELAAAGVFNLTLAGGEPTLHPNILEIIRRSVTGGMRVGLLSNGVAWPKGLADALEDCTTRTNFMVQISIDSTNPEINDYSRGKTKRVLDTLNELRTRSLDLQLSCVVHKKNMSTAHLLIDEYYPDIKRFHFLNIQRTSSALQHPDLLIDDDDALKFWLGLNEHAKRFPPDLFLPSLRIQMRALGRAAVDPEASLHRDATFDCAACSAGWTHLNVTSTFDVLGCDIAKDYTLMGNLRHHGFDEVWHSEQAAAVRNALLPACYKIRAPDGRTVLEQLLTTRGEKSAIPVLSASTVDGAPV